jgi:small subunit ribosomal protein S21
MGKPYQGGRGHSGKIHKNKRIRRTSEDFILPGAIGVRVPGTQSGDFETALRKFKKMVKETGIIYEIKSRREYKKPTTKRREQKKSAIRTNYKLLKEGGDFN